jgi:hypothetical protein
MQAGHLPVGGARRRKDDGTALAGAVKVFATRGFLTTCLRGAASAVAGRNATANVTAVKAESSFVSLFVTAFGAGCIPRLLVAFGYRLSLLSRQIVHNINDLGEFPKPPPNYMDTSLTLCSHPLSFTL